MGPYAADIACRGSDDTRYGRWTGALAALHSFLGDNAYNIAWKLCQMYANCQLVVSLPLLMGHSRVL